MGMGVINLTIIAYFGLLLKNNLTASVDRREGEMPQNTHKEKSE
jgi:hypothetical protein